MTVSPGFRTFVEDQLGEIVSLRSRAMFGGVGLYAGEHFFGLIDDDLVYLKVDDSNRSDYEELGMEPFRPYGEGSRPMQYYRLPGELLEDVHALRAWVEKAVAVARGPEAPE